MNYRIRSIISLFLIVFINLTNSIAQDKLATFGNGRYMLVEFLPSKIPSIHKDIFFELKMNNITPIIAHPERYRDVQSNYQMIYSLRL